MNQLMQGPRGSGSGQKRPGRLCSEGGRVLGEDAGGKVGRGLPLSEAFYSSLHSILGTVGKNFKKGNNRI